MWLPRDLNGLDPNTLFIAQAWRELVDPLTPDAYRARALDPFLLLEELGKVVALAQSDPKWLSHVQVIGGEIADSRGAADRLLLGAAARRAFAAAADAERAKGDDLRSISESCRIGISLAGCPREKLAEQLHSLIEADGAIVQKGRFLALLSDLATHIQRLGLGDESIEAISHVTLSESPHRLLEALAGTARAVPSTYVCFLAVTGPIDDLDALLAEVQVTRVGRPRIERTEQGRAWQEVHAGQYLVEIAATGPSRRIAAERALLEVKTALNLLVLYANRASHEVSTRVLVEDEIGVQYEIDVTPAKHFGLLPRAGYARTAGKRLPDLASKSGRISNILDAHALGISSQDPRAAIAHFWTALESIAGGIGSGSIGDRVANAIAPVVAARRVHKVVSYLALCIRQVKLQTNGTPSTDLLPASTQNHIAREDVLSCLTGTRDNPGVLELFRLAGSSPLLCQHLMKAWEELSDPRVLAKTLIRSEQRIKWQLMRIYRARNVFVHKGHSDDLIWRLLENAQSYVSHAIGRLIIDMGGHEDWNEDTSLEYQRQAFKALCDCLKQGGDPLVTSDLLAHLSDRALDVPLWGPDSRFGATAA